MIEELDENHRIRLLKDEMLKREEVVARFRLVLNILAIPYGILSIMVVYYIVNGEFSNAAVIGLFIGLYTIFYIIVFIIGVAQKHKPYKYDK